MNIVDKIKKLKEEKNAVILAHYYQRNEIQDVADFVGDSLALAQWAAKTDADILVVCGVNFMGETAKILCPDKKVLIPDNTAGCSLADSCKAEELAEFIKQYPGYKVISYVNTTAEVKALTDVVVTSSNAKEIVESFPKDEKIIFGPDRNLGSYINSVTGREMVVWNGACDVHEQFSLQKIKELKEQNPDAEILAHPECKKHILIVADKVGSTAALLNYAIKSDCKKFIVATESGILHKMRLSCPDKEFIPAPPEDSSCACNECAFMKYNTLEKLYNSLLNEEHEVFVDEEIRKKAVISIQRMLDISEKLKL
ncbi:MAG: quinolinate synthase NadA [Bacteroidales bacterium]|nr:quinolinate synthase NadA [Bacteroidales bacterium]